MEREREKEKTEDLEQRAMETIQRRFWIQNFIGCSLSVVLAEVCHRISVFLRVILNGNCN